MIAAVALLLAGSACVAHGPAGGGAAGEKPGPVDAPPLRSVSGVRRIGAAVESRHLGEAVFATVLATNFNSLTPENEMKWTYVEPSPGQFAFGGGDALVAFAAAHAMRVRGHTLVWHGQLPPWVRRLSGEALRAALVAHVRGVVAHYRGRVAQWDVVNEALADGQGGGLRGDSPFSALGPGFIEEALRTAHAADPDAILFYNDYEIEAPGAAKTEAAYRMVQQLRAAGAPIGGVGFQMHVDPRHWPPASAIRQNLERFSALGLAVEITEMDVPIGELAGAAATRFARQSVLTHDIVAACVALPGCSGVTFWGLTDRYSWLNDARWGRLRGRPPYLALPFDADYQPKPMAGAIAAALSGN